MSKGAVKKKRGIDNKIVADIKRGEKKRFQEIEARYHNKLFFYLRHLVGSKEESEDLLQNVFIKAFEKIHTFDNRRQFSSWIYRIAHNEAVNWLKRRNKRRLVSWEDVVSIKDKLITASDEYSPQDNWIRKELRDEVRGALDKLPKQYKEVLVLRFYFDHSYEEISEIIGKPKNTVGTLINRAKKKLIKVINVEDL